MPRAGTWMALVGVALAAVVGAYAVGSRRGPTGATASRQITAAPKAASAPKTTSAPQSAAAPQNAAATPTPGRMDETTFWRLVAETRAGAGNDTGRQSELLEARLRQLPARQIAGFERIRRSLDRRIYTWDVWGAAYVIEDGCSDDCFRDFRSYVISLGRGPYEAALRNPDALAPVVNDAETGGLGERRRRRARPTRASATRTSPGTARTSRATREARPGTTITSRRWCNATRGWQRASDRHPPSASACGRAQVATTDFRILGPLEAVEAAAAANTV